MLYNFNDLVVYSKIKIPLLKKQISKVSPDIIVRFFFNVSKEKMEEKYNGYMFEERIARSSFNNSIPRCKSLHNGKILYYKNQVLFEIIKTSKVVIVEVIVDENFSTLTAKEMLSTDALPLAAFILKKQIFIHASCVKINSKTVVFLGDGGAGKSTLSLYLNCNNFEVLSDDIICIDFKANMPYTTSYLSALRVWQESYKKLCDKYYGKTSNKKYLIPINIIQNEWVKIDSFYLINRGKDSIRIDRIGKMDGFISLISSLILGFVFDNEELRQIKYKIKKIVDICNFYSLHYLNGYEHLKEVVLKVKENEK